MFVVDKDKNNVIFSFTVINKKSLAIGLSRVGAPDQRIVAMSLEDMQHLELGPPLHSLVLPAPDLHPLELDYLAQFR